jgi:signal peptidase I
MMQDPDKYEDLTAPADPAVRRRRLLLRLRGVLFATVVVTALAIFALVMVVPVMGGYERYVVTGGSMTGAIPKGALIYDARVPVASLRVGDVITYAPPGTSRLVTHRIVSITKSPSGGPVFETKGDANQVVDPWKFTLVRPEQAVYRFSIPYMGYVLAALTLPISRLVLLALPALIIALLLLRGLWREAGDVQAWGDIDDVRVSRGGESV